MQSYVDCVDCELIHNPHNIYLLNKNDNKMKDTIISLVGAFIITTIIGTIIILLATNYENESKIENKIENQYENTSNELQFKIDSLKNELKKFENKK